MPEQFRPEIHKLTDDARAGETRGVVRYVLVASLLLIIIGFGLIYFFNQ